MAEAGISLVIEIIELATFATKVIRRLNEFREAAHAVPKALRDFDAQIHLLQEVLRSIHSRIDADGLDEDGRKSVHKVLDGCREQIAAFDALLAKSLPAADDSQWRRLKKAFVSVRQDKEIREMIQKIQQYIAVLTLYQSTRNAPSDTRKAPLMVIPFARDPQFVGRDAVLASLDHTFQTQKTVAIVGMGGIGKSQIAIEYCYRFREQNPSAHVLWIYAASMERIEGSMAKITKAAKLPGAEDPMVNKFALFQDWLSTSENGPWLLVIDNADDEDVFFGECPRLAYAPNGAKTIIEFVPHHEKGRILVTSRDRRLGITLMNQGEPIKVDPFTPEEARSYLASKLGSRESEDDITSLATALDKVPLAISQAAAFISANSIRITRYLQMLTQGEQSALKLLEKPLPDIRRDQMSLNSSSQTLRLSFQYIRENEPQAADLFSVMCCLDRQSISEDLLQSPDDDILEYELAIGRLLAFSLISLEHDGHSYSMHRLTQLSARSWLEADGRLAEWETRTLHSVYGRLPKTDGLNIKIFMKLRTQIEVLSDREYMDPKDKLLKAKFISIVGWLHRTEGHYATAVELGEKAMEIEKEILPSGSLEYYADALTLSYSYCYAGNYDKAVELLSESLSRFKKQLGPTHTATLYAETILVEVLCQKGNLQDARELVEPLIITLRAKSLTGEEIWMLSLSRASIIYRYEGRLDKAYQTAEENKQSLKGTHPHEHPGLLWTAQQMGEIELLRGHYKEAQALLDDSFKVVCDASLKLINFAAVLILNTMVRVFFFQKRYQDAEQLLQSIYDKNCASYGEGTNENLRVTAWRVDIYRSQGKLEEADKFAKDIEDVKVSVQSLQSIIITTTVYESLLLLRMAQRRWEEAEAIQLEKSKLEETVFPVHNPERIAGQHNLALIRAELGHRAEAITMMREVIKLQRDVYGEDNVHSTESTTVLKQWETEEAAHANQESL